MPTRKFAFSDLLDATGTGLGSGGSLQIHRHFARLECGLVSVSCPWVQVVAAIRRGFGRADCSGLCGARGGLERAA